jgi:hypothetical protein
MRQLRGPWVFAARLAGVGLLGLLASVLITGCGGGSASGVQSILTATRAGSTVIETVETETAPATSVAEPGRLPVTVTVSETIPAEPVTVTTPPQIVTVTAPADTVTTTTPAQTVTATTPAQTTTLVETTTVVNAAAAAAAGAAVASSQTEGDEGVTSEQWGWIAFGVLLLLVVLGGVVWIVQRRRQPT